LRFLELLSSFLEFSLSSLELSFKGFGGFNEFCVLLFKLGEFSLRFLEFSGLGIDDILEVLFDALFFFFVFGEISFDFGR